MSWLELIQAEQAIVRVSHGGRARYGLVEKKRLRLYEGSPFAGAELGPEIDPGQARLLAPCRPSKVVAVGLNYRSHAEEMKKPLPGEPLIFLKPASAVIGPHEPIILPPQSKRVDHECELAVVIGRKCRWVSPEQAHEYVLGFTCLNDVTARDLQAKDVQYTRAKGFDTFCPIGPCIALGIDPGALNVRTYLDASLRQQGNTSDLIFSVWELVSFISSVMTLVPGDVIATGTPAGVGPISHGQEVVIEVEGIGRLPNPVRKARRRQK